MKEPLRRLLVLPLLAPLLAVLLVGALHPRPPLRLRLLIWTTPAWPAGVWLAGAGLLGAALSAGGTALALRAGGGPAAAGFAPGVDRRTSRREGRGGAREPEPWETPFQPRDDWDGKAAAAAAPASASPSRAPGEPPPTVSVPYRVVRRGSGAAGSTAAAGPTPSPQASVVADDWGSPSSEDW
ncbi:MAG: hypothetical protein ACOVNL_11745 [Prochlorococcaceae cyanobacterium]